MKRTRRAHWRARSSGEPAARTWIITSSSRATLRGMPVWAAAPESFNRPRSQGVFQEWAKVPGTAGRTHAESQRFELAGAAGAVASSLLDACFVCFCAQLTPERSAVASSNVGCLLPDSVGLRPLKKIGASCWRRLATWRILRHDSLRIMRLHRHQSERATAASCVRRYYALRRHARRGVGLGS